MNLRPDSFLPTGALSDMQFIAECGSSKPQQKDIAVAKSVNHGFLHIDNIDGRNLGKNELV